MYDVITAPGGLISLNGCFELSLQKDANLVLYRRGGGRGRSVVWASHTDLTRQQAGGWPMSWLNLQDDCNLVLYVERPLWETNTRGDNCSLSLLDDGNVVLLDVNNGKILWQTHTAGGVSTRAWWDLG